MFIYDSIIDFLWNKRDAPILPAASAIEVIELVQSVCVGLLDLHCAPLQQYRATLWTTEVHFAPPKHNLHHGAKAGGLMIQKVHLKSIYLLLLNFLNKPLFLARRLTFLWLLTRRRGYPILRRTGTSSSRPQSVSQNSMCIGFYRPCLLWNSSYISCVVSQIRRTSHCRKGTWRLCEFLRFLFWR